MSPTPSQVPFNFFNEIYEIDPSTLDDLQDRRRQILMSTKFNEKIEGASLCMSSSGKRYYYGPWFVERINQWQTFILATRKMRYGKIYHYSGFLGQGQTPWTDYVQRFRIPNPMTQAAGIWLCNEINITNGSTGLIFSGTLLADLLLFAKKNGISIRRSVVFTTFEPFPDSLSTLRNEVFDDHCDYMRSWDGGLTYWRCPNGGYHTLDNATVIDVIRGQACVTDLTNFAQSFSYYNTGDFVDIDDKVERCACGMYHKNFRHVRSSSWDLVDRERNIVHPFRDKNDLPAGFQVYQPEPGIAFILAPSWDGVDDMHIQDRLSAAGIDSDKRVGVLRRRDKKPPIFSDLISRERKNRLIMMEGDGKREDFSQV